MVMSPLPANNSVDPLDLNINISAYRVLFILLQLVKYRSLNAIELNGFLYENPLIQRSYNTETLTKYVNTLREVGCQIPRSSNRNDYCYELLKSPFLLQFEANELKLIQKLQQAMAQQSDSQLYDDFCQFMERLSWCLPNATLPAVLDWPDDGSVLCSRRTLLERFRKFCRDGFAIRVEVMDGFQPKEMTLEPHEVFEQGERLLLLATDQKSQTREWIDLSQVLQAHPLPIKIKRQTPKTTVVFALYGRLGKSYRLYPGEKIIFRNQERLHVKAQVVEPQVLLNRLLKYGPACQVLSPVVLRQEMQEKIARLLSVLEEGTSTE